MADGPLADPRRHVAEDPVEPLLASEIPIAEAGPHLDVLESEPPGIVGARADREQIAIDEEPARPGKPSRDRKPEGTVAATEIEERSRGRTGKAAQEEERAVVHRVGGEEPHGEHHRPGDDDPHVGHQGERGAGHHGQVARDEQRLPAEP